MHDTYMSIGAAFLITKRIAIKISVNYLFNRWVALMKSDMDRTFTLPGDAAAKA